MHALFSRTPIWLLSLAVVIYALPPVAIFLTQGRVSAAFLVVLGMVFSAGLGSRIALRGAGAPRNESP
ncbi:hypothetical protein Cs7R123_45130 [Catellatospora sp. TT07R-123]|uniref:hypothetical protein n=1 Tax=Catellatospora sp. TT07R-123 TaxID=2733863 RepID=UPI001B1E527A|nr:hypothetical protein [Catellatospora sp. TT07R-123]GHJ47171.1 hypothetical protein Cs7R123_45130 [Catellatospora sp. TT07R-123]